MLKFTSQSNCSEPTNKWIEVSWIGVSWIETLNWGIMKWMELTQFASSINETPIWIRYMASTFHSDGIQEIEEASDGVSNSDGIQEKL